MSAHCSYGCRLDSQFSYFKPIIKNEWALETLKALDCVIADLPQAHLVQHSGKI